MRYLSALILAVLFPLHAFAATASIPTNYTNDDSVDMEPSVTRATNALGQTSTVVVTIKKYNDPVTGAPRTNNYFVTKDGTSTYNGFMPMPSGMDTSGDPYLYPDQNSTGAAPKRLYCVGIVNSNHDFLTNRIVVWRSNNIGRNDWVVSTPFAVSTNVTNPDGSRVVTFPDKPTIVVSMYSGSRGHVYVAYTRFVDTYAPGATNPTRTFNIMITRSTDGGVTFETPVQIHSSSNYTNAPHVVHSGTNGYVYVTWADYGATTTAQGRIYLARSPGAGVISGSWVLDSNGPTGWFERNRNVNAAQVMTIPITRYNHVSNKITIVWSERQQQSTSGVGARQDVYYAEKGSAGWTVWGTANKLKVSNEASPCLSGTTNVTTDQWHPALDFNSTGTSTIVYHDRQYDCASNDRFHTMFAQVDRYGALVQGPTPITKQTGFDVISDTDQNVSNNSRWLGEYHDIWCETSACYAAFLVTTTDGVTSRGDIYVSVIQ